MNGFLTIKTSTGALSSVVRVFPMLILFALTYSQSVSAEVYRWVDAQGKTHYSDKKADKHAADITAEVSQQNIDTSIEEQRKLQQIFRPENAADRAYYRQQQLQQQPDAEMIKHCNEQRKYLNNIKGRVQFIDEQGQMINVTEKERQAEVQRVENYIASRC